MADLETVGLKVKQADLNLIVGSLVSDDQGIQGRPFVMSTRLLNLSDIVNDNKVIFAQRGGKLSETAKI